jgi:hypothetical protein
MASVIAVASDNIPRFDELYSVSDLHMGGRTGFQIFASGQELAALIEHVRTRDQGSKIAFVINGDAVDFLAEPDAKAFDPAGAVAKLTRIMDDPAFKPAWDALRSFVRTERRHLIITLGNHDLELALPWVRTHFLTLLAGDDESARGRITLAFDGAGYLCRVGTADILCVHGNEVDDWNVTDFEAIRRLGTDVQQGRPVEDWMPNAGTKLVIEVMNDIKKSYPFVDLLKPEAEGVIPTLVAIAPEKRGKIGNAIPALTRLATDKVRRFFGFLSAEEEDDPEAVRNAALLHPPVRMHATALLALTEERLLKDIEPISLVPDEEREGQLGIRSAIFSGLTGAEPSEVLRDALEQVRKDRSFDHGAADGTFDLLDQRVGPKVDFLLAGHTHLERALARGKGRGWYFNSGTWARLIKLEEDVLSARDKFADVYSALTAGTIAALEKFVLDRRTVIAIRQDAAATKGELLHWTNRSGAFALEAVDPPAVFVKS